MKTEQRQVIKKLGYKLGIISIWFLLWFAIDFLLDLVIDFPGPTDIIKFLISSFDTLGVGVLIIGAAILGLILLELE